MLPHDEPHQRLYNHNSLQVMTNYPNGCSMYPLRRTHIHNLQVLRLHTISRQSYSQKVLAGKSGDSVGGFLPCEPRTTDGHVRVSLQMPCNRWQPLRSCLFQLQRPPDSSNDSAPRVQPEVVLESLADNRKDELSP